MIIGDTGCGGGCSGGLGDAEPSPLMAAIRSVTTAAGAVAKDLNTNAAAGAALVKRVAQCYASFNTGSEQCKHDIALLSQQGAYKKAWEKEQKDLALKEAAVRALNMKNSASQTRADTNVAVQAAKDAGYDVKRDGSIVRSTSSGLTNDPNGLPPVSGGFFDSIPMPVKIALVGGLGYVGYTFMKKGNR